MANSTTTTTAPVPSTLPTTSHPADTQPQRGNKIIHLIRHAQGFHNLSWANHALPDPLLTDLGKAQCTTVAHTFPPAQADSITLLAASPLRRTLWTAKLCFPSLLARGRILALPQAQEISDEPADTGSDVDVLEKEFDAAEVDLSLVCDGWNGKTGEYAPEAEALKARGRYVRRWLRERPERVIVLVTHGAFLHYLTQDWSGFEPALGTAWRNCEWRTYEFGVSGAEDGDAGLVETRASRERRVCEGQGTTMAEKL